MRKVKLVETNSEIGAGTRGSSLGAEAVKIASLNAGSNYFAKKESVVIQNENHVLFDKPDDSYAKNIIGLTKTLHRLSNSVSDLLKSESFPIILAGDHSNAAGTIAGIKKANPNKRLGVIWIDAHADLHSPYTSPSGNMHGMPLAIALADDNLAQKANNISRKTSLYWEELKAMAGVYPMIDYRDIVFIGVRDTEKEEEYLMHKHRLRNFTVSEVRTKGIDKTIKEIEDYLSACDLIYISFDVDSMDPAYISHGTGTPVPLGFFEHEATEILLKLLANDKVCCFEIAEINPVLDEKRNVMAETAFRILEKSTSAVENRLNTIAIMSMEEDCYV